MIKKRQLMQAIQLSKVFRISGAWADAYDAQVISSLLVHTDREMQNSIAVGRKRVILQALRSSVSNAKRMTLLPYSISSWVNEKWQR